MLPLLQRLGRYPRVCVWELTLACNLRCLHCGSFAGARRADELDDGECERVVDELAALGCEKVTLSGGEPTLHPRWHELAARVRARGMRANLISNGWSWSAAHVAMARDAGLATIGFSLDGLEHSHDTVRRAGSYARVLGAIDACVAAGLSVSVVTHINRLNCRELPELREVLAARGVAGWQLQLGNPGGAMHEHDELVIAPHELLWLVPLIARLRGETDGGPAIFAADNIGYYGAYERALRGQGARIDFWIGCRAGCQVLGIESNGNVKGCLSLPSARHGEDVFVEGNLRTTSLAELWHRGDGFAFNRTFSAAQLGGFCAHCRYGDICRGGCAWTAYCHTANHLDNPYCFYRQALEHGRLDLLGDDQPSAAELAAVARRPA